MWSLLSPQARKKKKKISALTTSVLSEAAIAQFLSVSLQPGERCILNVSS